MNSFDHRRRKEMEEIWDSFEWILRKKLESLGHNIWTMRQEMKIIGVTDSMLAEFLPRQIKSLIREVIREQEKEYKGKRRVMK